jgi:hypothetical protein
MIGVAKQRLPVLCGYAGCAKSTPERVSKVVNADRTQVRLSPRALPGRIVHRPNSSSPEREDPDGIKIPLRLNDRPRDVEFMRIFDHLYVPYVVARLNEEGKSDPEAGYLKEKTDEWLPQQYVGRKDLRRRYFVEG